MRNALATMRTTDAAIKAARALLRPADAAPTPPWAGLASAGLAAVAATLLAGVVVLGPGLSLGAQGPVQALSALAASGNSTLD